MNPTVGFGRSHKMNLTTLSGHGLYLGFTANWPIAASLETA